MVTFDPDALAARIAELEQELSKPGFWDDQQHAATVSAEHARLTRRLERFNRLRREYEDARELLAMDGDMAAEIESSLQPLRQELERLQEDALFNGEYDAGDAVVTIQSGGGGTDSQDWAEMLLRMYQRWAERRGFQDGDARGEPRRGGRPQVRDDDRPRRERVRNPQDRARAAPARPAVAVRPGAPAAHVVRRRDRVPAAQRRDDLEIDESDLRIDTYRAQGAGGQHVNKTDSAVRITHLPTGIVAQCQNERSQAANKQTAMRILKSRLAELAEEEREAELAKERGDVQNIGFGGEAVRHYVLHPYQQVKDERTGLKVGNAQGVLDGDLDQFVHAYLLAKAAGKRWLAERLR